MCFFDCKCKSLKRLGENIKQTERYIKQTTDKLKEKHKNKHRNTGYPAHEPTVNKYLSGSGWEFSIVFLFYFYLFLCFSLNSFNISFFILMLLCVFSIVNAKA